MSSKNADPLKPSARLLSKIGSIAVHADELLSANGHPYDRAALDLLIADPEVKEWLEEMGAMVPQKREKPAL